MLNHRNLWSLEGLTRARLLAIVDSAQALKRAAQSAGVPQLLRGKNVAVLSDDHTSSAAVDFHRAAAELGAQVAHIRATDPGQSDRRDPRDTAGLLGQLYDAIECEGLSDEQVQQLDLHAGVPVYNGIGRLDHSTRAIADVMTLQEFTGQPLDQMCLYFAGDLRSPAGRALAAIAGLTGLELRGDLSGLEAAKKSPEPAGQAAVVEATRALAVCEPAEGGRLPLHLVAAGTAAQQALLQAQASNQRHVLQALLAGTIA